MKIDRTSKGLLLLALVSALAPTSSLAVFTGADTFSSITSNWVPAVGNGVGQYSVTNERLEYTTYSTPTANDYFAYHWAANTNDYSESWTLRVDTFLGSFPMASGGYAAVGLSVSNADDLTGDIFRLSLRRDGPSARYFDAHGYSNGVFQDTEFIPTVSLSAALQLSYSASNHVFTASYDSNGSVGGYVFSPFYTLDIDTGSSGWGMSLGQRFQLLLSAQSVNTQLLNGQAYFDNFVIVPEPCSLILMTTGAVLLAVSRRRNVLMHSNHAFL